MRRASARAIVASSVPTPPRGAAHYGARVRPRPRPPNPRRTAATVAVMGSRRTEVALGALAGLTAANAIGGAVYGVRGAPEVPRAWLAGSPFRDYTVPGVV